MIIKKMKCTLKRKKLADRVKFQTVGEIKAGKHAIYPHKKQIQ